MSLAAVLATTGEFVSVAKGVSDLLANGKLERRKLRPVLNALEKLYFSPIGILSVLKEIAAGREPDRQLVQVSLLEFNDIEPKVQSAVQALDFDALSAADFPLRLRSSLQSAAYGKLSLRRDLQNALNVPSDKLMVQREDAQKLVDRILLLNAELESLDEALR